MVRRELLLIILLLVVIGILAMAIQFFKPEIVEADARLFVLEDLKTKYPGADVGIMTVSEKTNAAGSKYFEVKARVTKNGDGPCPERSHIYYNYPAQNFIAQPPDVITKDCQVCTEGTCTIAFAEEAIIASHTFEGTDIIQSYIGDNPNAIPYVDKGRESWNVSWISQDAEMYYVAEIHINGAVLNVSMVETTGS